MHHDSHFPFLLLAAISQLTIHELMIIQWINQHQPLSLNDPFSYLARADGLPCQTCHLLCNSSQAALSTG